MTSTRNLIITSYGTDIFRLIVKEVEYGRGEASSKRDAKETAAEVALRQLMEEVGEV